jgi:hypothetical protein
MADDRTDDKPRANEDSIAEEPARRRVRVADDEAAADVEDEGRADMPMKRGSDRRKQITCIQSNAQEHLFNDCLSTGQQYKRVWRTSQGFCSLHEYEPFPNIRPARKTQLLLIGMSTPSGELTELIETMTQCAASNSVDAATKQKLGRLLRQFCSDSLDQHSLKVQNFFHRHR